MPPFLYNISMCKTLVLSITSHRNEVILIRKKLQDLLICDNTDHKITYRKNELAIFGKHQTSAICDVAIVAMVGSAMARSAMLHKQIINHFITNPSGMPFKEKPLTKI